MNFCAESISALCQAVSGTVFPQIVKFKMAVIGHLQFIFFVISMYNFLVWSPWYIEICLGCNALVIWDMTTINPTRYVIKWSLVRAPSGVCYFPPHKMSTFQGHSCVNLYRQIYKHTHPTHIYDALIWRLDTWRPSREYKMAKNISNVKLISVKLTQIHYDEAIIFDSHRNYLAWS